MIKLLKLPNDLFINMFSHQVIEPGINYVLSPYVIKDENAYYNVLSEEAVLIDDLEKDKRTLINHWFYIPDGFDTSSLCHTLRQKSLLQTGGPGSRLKSLYTIFTTTACNASCNYCFEKGCDVLTMDDNIAEKTADYIIRTSRRNYPVTLKWFGGEPLCNTRAINVITERLTNAGINFSSIMTTNGDLFNRVTDDELKKWKLRRVQLTADDVGEKYEKIKGLPEEAFTRLKETAARFEKLNIRISLRIHFSELTGDEPCYRIIEEFKSFKNVSMYVKIIYGNESVENYNKILRLEDYLISLKKRNTTFLTSRNPSHCMADNPRMATITPHGELSPCEHYANGEHIYGSIDNSKQDLKILANWAVREKYLDKECKKCTLYPNCRKLVMCPAEGKCSDGYQYYQIETIKRALRKKVEEINGRDSNTNN